MDETQQYEDVENELDVQESAIVLEVIEDDVDTALWNEIEQELPEENMILSKEK